MSQQTARKLGIVPAVMADVMTEAAKKGKPFTKIARALEMQIGMMNNGLSFDTQAQAFAIFASWHGVKVSLNGTTLLPPQFPTEETDDLGDGDQE